MNNVNFFESIRHVTYSDRNGFDSEYAIQIDFILGSSDSFTKNYKIVAYLIKHGNVVHDKRKNNVICEKSKTKTKEEKPLVQKF